MADEKLVKTVQTTFSLYGLVINRNLSVSLAKNLLSLEEDEREAKLTEIVEQILAQNLKDPHVEASHIKHAIEECVRPDTLQETETVLNVINAFDVPKIRYNLEKKKFVLENVGHDLFPEAVHKAIVIKERFEILWYRTLRHELFAPLKFGETAGGKMELLPIEYLLTESRTGSVCVMGLLTQLTEGQYYLEDREGIVKVDLKQTEFQKVLFMEGSIVIANGVLEDDILQVKNLFFPPAQSSENSRVDFGNANTFGGPHPVSLKVSEKLKIHETDNNCARMFFLSDLWVDDLKVLKQFRTLLEGFSDDPPIAFILCGQFLSFPLNVTSAQKLKEGFTKLAEIIDQYPDIKRNTKFIFVPGPKDIGSPKILPRHPLPKSIVKNFIRSVPGTIFATNPCRLQYCTKEIVIFREDSLTKMCRNTLHLPDEGAIYEHFAKSIICQAHLAPLALPMMPVYWKYDHALRLFPMPDVVVVADQAESYCTNYAGCHVINPGCFPKNNFSFISYLPARDKFEECMIPQDTEEQ